MKTFCKIDEGVSLRVQSTSVLALFQMPFTPFPFPPVRLQVRSINPRLGGVVVRASDL